jgi:hypothetical protein
MNQRQREIVVVCTWGGGRGVLSIDSSPDVKQKVSPLWPRWPFSRLRSQPDTVPLILRILEKHKNSFFSQLPPAGNANIVCSGIVLASPVSIRGRGAFHLRPPFIVAPSCIRIQAKKAKYRLHRMSDSRSPLLTCDGRSQRNAVHFYSSFLALRSESPKHQFFWQHSVKTTVHHNLSMASYYASPFGTFCRQGQSSLMTVWLHFIHIYIVCNIMHEILH